MKYHRLDNESPLIPQSPEMQQQSNIQDTSVECEPPYSHSPVLQGHTDGFHGRAELTKKFGKSKIQINHDKKKSTSKSQYALISLPYMSNFKSNGESFI